MVTGQKFEAQLEAKQQAIQVHNQKYDQLIAAIMDPAQTPALIPQTRRYATVTIEGQQASYRTHQESRMACFKDVFNLHAQPRPVPGSPPPRSLDEISDTPAAPQRRFNNPRVQRAYDVFNQLRAIMCPSPRPNSMERYMAARDKKPEDFASPPAQADFATFVVEDTEANMDSVRWSLRQNLEAAGIPDLRDNVYEGD